MSIKYYYKETNYDSEQAVREAIWDKEHKVFGSPETEEEWKALCVILKESEEETLT